MTAGTHLKLKRLVNKASTWLGKSHTQSPEPHFWRGAANSIEPRASADAGQATKLQESVTTNEKARATGAHPDDTFQSPPPRLLAQPLHLDAPRSLCRKSGDIRPNAAAPWQQTRSLAQLPSLELAPPTFRRAMRAPRQVASTLRDPSGLKLELQICAGGPSTLEMSESSRPHLPNASHIVNQGLQSIMRSHTP